VSWRRGVVAFFYLIDSKEELRIPTHDSTHDSMPQSVVALSKPLKNNKIFGIYCHVAA
jgi:hypothetical protein